MTETQRGVVKGALIGGAILLIVLIGSRLVGAAGAPRPYLSRFNPSGNVGAAAQVRAPGAGAAQKPAGAAAAPAAHPGAATGSAARAPAGTDPALPYGVPLLRGDWVITKDYEAHGGLRPPPDNSQGAVDFAFWHDKDALGADVIATHTGKIKLLQDDLTYGNLVYVLGARWSTTYGHLKDFVVHEGDTVTRGQVIGHMGATGDATGPHLDYQVWDNGANRNPVDYCHCGARGPDAPNE